MATATPDRPLAEPHVRSDGPFYAGLIVLSGTYVVLILGMLLAQASYTTPGDLWAVLARPDVRHAVQLSLVSSSLTTLLALWVAVPAGYLLSRFDFPGRRLLDAVLDIPIVLPPLVVGVALLILFQTAPGQWFEDNVFRVTFAVPGVVLAQFAVACAFAVRTMRATFDQIDPRREQVALTLGCSRGQAFWLVVLPETRAGIVTAATLAWARALGEFGPILVFSGSTRMRTRVLPTTAYLDLSIGNLEAAVAVSLLMVAAAVVVLVLMRLYGTSSLLEKGR
jgi:molybdate transport system permease protein